MKKRILSLVLTACMLLGMLPVTAGAVENSPLDISSSSTDVQIQTIFPGATVTGSGGTKTITLGADVTLSNAMQFSSGSYVLDLNGYTISYTIWDKDNWKYRAVITVFGNGAPTLTIRDSGSGTAGKIKVALEYSAKKSEPMIYAVRVTSGTLTLESGEIIMDASIHTNTSGDYNTTYTAAVYADGGTFNMTGGTLTGIAPNDSSTANRSFIYGLYCGTTVNVSGGTIVSDGNAVQMKGDSTLTVSGNAVLTGKSALSVMGINSFATVTGGTLTGAATGITVSSTGNLNLSGGTIKATGEGSSGVSYSLLGSSYFKLSGNPSISGKLAAISGNAPFELTGALGNQAAYKVYYSSPNLSNATTMVKSDGTYEVTEADMAKLTCGNNRYRLKFVGTGTDATIQLVEAIPVDSVSLDSTTVTLEPTRETFLIATVLPANAFLSTVTWSSSDASVATVSSLGLVTAVDAGTATITATSQMDSSKTATCVVTVARKLATPTSLAWDSTVPAKATWGAVENASGYSVQLYKGGSAVGIPVAATGNSYDFTTAITETGSYKFSVTAKGNGSAYLDSAESSLSTTYTYTAAFKPINGGVSSDGNVYANGNAITLIAGTSDAKKTNIYYDGDSTKTPITLTGFDGDTTSGYDLTRATIFGGSSNNANCANIGTSITMVGGEVYYLRGGGEYKAPSASTLVTMKGGAAYGISGGAYGTGGAVSGASKIVMEGGSVSSVDGYSDGTVGSVLIQLKGGTVKNSVTGCGTLKTEDGASKIPEGGAQLELSGNITVGEASYYSIWLDTFTDGKVQITGALTGGAGKIRASNAKYTENGAIAEGIGYTLTATDSAAFKLKGSDWGVKLSDTNQIVSYQHEARYTPKGGDETGGTFAEALAAMTPSGGEITLLKNVNLAADATANITSSVTLDLGGKTLDSVTGYNTVNVASGGNLTLKGTGGGTLAAAAGSSGSPLAIAKGGAATIESGTIAGGKSYAINNSGVLSLGGTPTLTTSGMHVMQRPGSTLSAKVGNTPYGGEAIKVIYADATADGTTLVSDVTDAEQAAKFDVYIYPDYITSKFDANAIKAVYKSYSITYKDGTEDFSGTHDANHPTTHTYGTETALVGASKPGYTFEGWYKEDTLTNKLTTLAATAYTANITLYAKWTAAAFKPINGGVTFEDGNIYANGNELTTVRVGVDYLNTCTNIYYTDDPKKTPIDLSAVDKPDAPGSAKTGYDLSWTDDDGPPLGPTLFGGSKSTNVDDVVLHLTGGEIFSVYGSGGDGTTKSTSSASVGNITIDVGQGMSFNYGVFAAGYNGTVTGNVEVTVNDGTVANLVGYSSFGTFGGTASATVKGGTLLMVDFPTLTLRDDARVSSRSDFTGVYIKGGTRVDSGTEKFVIASALRRDVGVNLPAGYTGGIIATGAVAGDLEKIKLVGEGATGATMKLESGNVIVTVTAVTPPTHVPVTGITDVPATATANIDLTLTGTVAPANATNKGIVWSVKNAGTTGATINGATLKTTAAGTVTVTATIANGLTASTAFTRDFTITVAGGPVAVTGVTLDRSVATLYSNSAPKTVTLVATVAPASATNRVVTWGSSNAAVATVDTNGVVTAVADGTTNITATTEDGGKTATCVVTVKPLVTVMMADFVYGTTPTTPVSNVEGAVITYSCTTVTDATPAGTYTVTATKSGVSATASFRILKAPVAFSVTNNVVEHSGSTKTATVTATPNAPHTVAYTQAGVTVDAPTAVGVYDIWAEITDPNYAHAAGNQTKAHIGTLTIYEAEKPAPTTYAVTFKSGGGTGVDPTQANTVAGGSFVLPANPYTNIGNLFDGWTSGGKHYAPGERFVMPAQPVTFTAAWTPVFNIDGGVEQDNKPAQDATVTLMLGTRQIAVTKATADGKFQFTSVTPGTYNLVATKGGVTVTIKMVIVNASTEANIVLPTGKTNSVVEVKDGTPNLVVGGLEKVFDTVDDDVFTTADKAVVSAGGAVEFKLTVEEKTATGVGADKGKIDGIKPADKTVLLYLDLKVDKTSTPLSGVAATTSVPVMSTLLENIIPLPAALQGKASYSVYRVHDGTATELTTTPNGGGEYISVNADKTMITVYAKQFSTYAIAYSDTPTAPPNGTSDYTPPSYEPVVPPVDGGSISVTPKTPKPGDTVTVTPKPDDGNEVDKIVVKDKDGNEIPVTKTEDGSYTFTQPKGTVTITVTFQPQRAKWNPFADVASSDWFHDSVKHVYENGLMTGTQSDKFSPKIDSSRAMIATILWRMAGEPKAKTAASFPDVPADAYYAAAVAWPEENGVIKGYASGAFGPDDSITREQLVALLWRYAGSPALMDYKGLARYTDTAEISLYAAPAMTWAHQQGIISGKVGDLLDPKGNATRAEVAAMLQRFATRVAQ